MKLIFSVLLSAVLVCCFAQKDTIASNYLTYIELYNSSDLGTNRIAQSSKSYLFNYDEVKNLHLNIIYGKASYKYKKFLSNIAIQGGTYVKENYTFKTDYLNSINEANIGYEDDHFSVMAGLLPSHIGFETIIGIDNPTLTRSLMAENSPYYETGIQLKLKKENGTFFSILALNGWQNTFDNFDHGLSLGSQLFYVVNDKISLNWSTFLGRSSGKLRFFNDTYLNYHISEKLKLILAWDFGIQNNAIQNSRSGFWNTKAAILHYKFNDKLSTAFRAEQFVDKNSIVVQYGKINSYSFNTDYKITKYFFIRAEYRTLYENFKSTNTNNSRLITSLIFKY